MVESDRTCTVETVQLTLKTSEVLLSVVQSIVWEKLDELLCGFGMLRKVEISIESREDFSRISNMIQLRLPLLLRTEKLMFQVNGFRGTLDEVEKRECLPPVERESLLNVAITRTERVR